MLGIDLYYKNGLRFSLVREENTLTSCFTCMARHKNQHEVVLFIFLERLVVVDLENEMAKQKARKTNQLKLCNYV